MFSVVLTLLLLLASTGSASAAVRYVDVNSTNATTPYTNWATAAATIQQAVDAAAPGDEIVVTNGLYATGGRAVGTNVLVNRVAVDKPLALRSVNGPEFTIIQGYQVPVTTNGDGAIRCVYLTNGASLSGFTLTNGATRDDLDHRERNGGGVWCESTGAVVSNCDFIANSAFANGGGAFLGTLNNCTFTRNLASLGGGASGFFSEGCLLNNCTLTGNSASYGGGMVWGVANNCTLTGNAASSGGGGAAGSKLNNCTLSGNSASFGGGVSFSGVDPSVTLNNCIVYSNTATDGPNYFPDSVTLNYCCTTPMPTNGVGNLTNAPLFVDAAAGNYRLQPDSPCIDAGTNLSAILTNDLEGRPRPVDGNGDGPAAFDIGAYEYGALYVWQDSPSPTPPYGTWATAATNIQDAVDAALAGDEIVVTNGTYTTGGRAVYGTMTNRVAVDKPLTVRSVNGPQVTVIQGYQVPGTTNGDGAIRCVYLTNGASLSGFTLTHGATRTNGDWEHEQNGGGVWCESATAVVSNCVIADNSASQSGGGAYWGTLNNCTLTGNSAPGGGGAAGDYYNPCILNNCTLSGNVGASGESASWGGGALYGTLNNCTLTGNSADHGGGMAGGTANNCTLTGNSAQSGGGAQWGTLNNCTLNGNSAGSGGGANGCTLNNCGLIGNSAETGGGTSQGTLNNCTLTENWAQQVGGGACEGTLNNCIVYSNTAPYGANYVGSPPLMNYCCTTPLPSDDVGNLTNAPLFVDYAGGNLRLQSNSPCINAGRNDYAPGPTDLDGLPRIVSGSVDIGAYEFQGPGSVISYAWLQRYGLPTDGSADYTDPDADGHTTWQEWRCQTDPTNALSVLRLLSASRAGNNVTVSWQSVAGVSYFLDRNTNLWASPPFTLLSPNLPGQPGTTTYTDTNAAIAPRLFYRVGVGN